MHIVALYAGLLALLYLVLSFRTIVLRVRLRVSLGDGGSEALQRAIRAHANFGEYVSLALVLQVLLASTGASATLLHGLGAALLLGRLLHAIGVSRVPEPLSLRMVGMVLTTGTLAASGVLLVIAGV